MSATSQTPCAFISAMPSSSIRLPCSIESMPASTAFLIACVPCALAAILRPAGGSAWSASSGPAAVDREEGLAPAVSHGGEARLDRPRRVQDCREGVLERRDLEPEDLVEPVRARTEVGVAVDQAGEDGRAREVKHPRPLGDRDP